MKDDHALKLLVTADLHYLARNLYDDGMAFRRQMAANVGKYTEGGSMIMQEFCRTAEREKPDAVLICGDLTYNGEKDSLQEIAGFLRIIKDAGIPVFVIPGNHDIDYPDAFRFCGKERVPAEKISTADFRQIMAPFGYADAFSSDACSLSYAAELSSDLRLLALDANTPEEPCRLRSGTLRWAEEILQQAEREGKQIITMSHQNLLLHIPFMNQRFLIHNHQETEALLRKYGVTVHLSGHAHLQHTSDSSGLRDICTESLALWPLQYGILKIDSKGHSSWENRSLDILQTESRERFDEAVRSMIMPQLQDLPLTEEEKEEMIALASQLNAMMFSGRKAAEEDHALSSAWQNWQKHAGGSFWHAYLKYILES